MHLPSAIYFKGDSVNSLGTIHENNILMKEYEGHSNDMAEYVRDPKLDDKEFSITNVSMTNYYISSKIYNKLSYLVGEIQMDEYMQKTNEKTLRDFLKEKLDDKYGEGTGQDLYKYVTNVSFFSRFTIDLKPEKIEGLYEKISKRNESVQQEIEKKGQSDELSSILDVNNNFKAMLDKIYNKDTKTINKKAYKNEKNKQLKGIEMLCLDCISKDIENINNKYDAIDYVIGQVMFNYGIIIEIDVLYLNIMKWERKHQFFQKILTNLKKFKKIFITNVNNIKHLI